MSEERTYGGYALSDFDESFKDERGYISLRMAALREMATHLRELMAENAELKAEREERAIEMLELHRKIDATKARYG